jgi:hypothetical protein
MSSCNPFDARARRACLKQAVAKFHRRVTILAYEIDADLAERGIGGLSSHPKIGNAFRSLGIIVDKALAFEKRAEKFQRQRFRDTGKFDQSRAWTEEDGKQLWERLRQEIEQLPELFYSKATRLCRLHGKVPNFRGTAATTANELSYRVGQAFAEGRARMMLLVKQKPRRRKRKPAPKVAERRKKREVQWKIDKAIEAEWEKKEWGTYQDYATWKNEYLPPDWPMLDGSYVGKAINRIKRRQRYAKK